MEMMKKWLPFLVFLLLLTCCVPTENLTTHTPIPPEETPALSPIPESTLTPIPTPILSPTQKPEPYQVVIGFFPDINANGRMDSLATNQRQALMVSYSDLVSGLAGDAVDQIQVDETFENLGFGFNLPSEICFMIKDGGEEILNECQLIQENVTFTIDSESNFSEEAVGFLTINGLNTVGIGYVGFSPVESIFPLNEEYAIRTTTYEQRLGEQTSIIIRKPFTEFLEDIFWIGVKEGNHVLPFIPLDVSNIQVRNAFDFSPDPAVKYDEFGNTTPLEHDENGKDGIDFYPMISDTTEQSMLIVAGTSGKIVFTDFPSRGVIEICPALESQKSCSALARNRSDPETISIVIGDTMIGSIEEDNLFMEPGEIVNPGYPVAVMGAQGFESGAISLQYSHRYRFQAHNALPMVELSDAVINGINLRDFPQAYIGNELIQRCSYSVFTADIDGDQLLGFPDETDCQIPFFSWVIYGNEVFVPLPDAELVENTGN